MSGKIQIYTWPEIHGKYDVNEILSCVFRYINTSVLETVRNSLFSQMAVGGHEQNQMTVQFF